MKQEKSTLFGVILIALEKVHYFSKATIPSNPSGSIFKS